MDKCIQDSKIYISDSKKSIDNYIKKKQYRNAFVLLLFVLQNIEYNDKLIFIDYYIENLERFGFYNSVQSP
jgi:hypothetical protein